MPDESEMDAGRRTLEEHGWKVDCIITHCSPRSVQRQITGRGAEEDPLADFLEEVMIRCDYKHWFLGHYHEELTSSDGRMQVLYHSIRLLDDPETRLDAGSRFEREERVSFSLREGGDIFTGRFFRIHEEGDGLHVTDEPAADVYTDQRGLIKYVPFSRLVRERQK